MIPRVVYDTMVVFQWFIIPEGRQHGTFRAVVNDRVRLLLSSDLIDEVRNVLGRHEIRTTLLRDLTDERINSVLNFIIARGEVWPNPKPVFTLPEHPDDDHVFNLAIAGRADFLVTWENRLLKLAEADSPAGRELRALAPQLAIVNPIDFMAELKRRAQA